MPLKERNGKETKPNQTVHLARLDDDDDDDTEVHIVTDL